jgi:hypothetical protein
METLGLTLKLLELMFFQMEFLLKLKVAQLALLVPAVSKGLLQPLYLGG